MRRLILFLIIALVSSAGLASGLINTSGQLNASSPENASPPERAVQQSQWHAARYGTPAAGQTQAAAGQLQPFGAHLFDGGFSGVRSDGLNPDYRILPGDQVTLRLWGALDLERLLPVDSQGNLFIPSVGPVAVQGTRSQELNQRIRAAINAVYPENVEVYTNLQGVQPVSVFVTGYVQKPGRYAGTPHESLLFFLDQAGGIDQQLGSYRNIRILRDGKPLAQIDLYDFLLNGQLLHGQLKRLQFQEGDVILVEERGPFVEVQGEVQKEYAYELKPGQQQGADLLKLARVTPHASHALVRGSRLPAPLASYQNLNTFKNQPLKAGDRVFFTSDRRSDTLVVQLEGSFYGPSRLAVPRDTRLHELLDAVAVPRDLTQIKSISLRRVSVAERQRESLNESLRRLESTYLTASSSTPEEASIRVQEAELVRQFVERASQVEPSGRLVVAYQDRIQNLRLQDGDVITLPEYNDSVLISGEVLVPQSVVYMPSSQVYDYIDRAGGFSGQADEDQILLVRQNGEVLNARQAAVMPGDEILILPEVPTKNLQLASTLSQILYQVAIAAKVALDL